MKAINLLQRQLISKSSKAQLPSLNHSLLRTPSRSFFSQMGFDEFSETQVLMNIQNGVYTYPQHAKKHRINFDKSSRLMIYDVSMHYLQPSPSNLEIYSTALFLTTSLHQYFIADYFRQYLFTFSVTGLAYNMIKRWILAAERRKSIAQIYLVQHGGNRDYAQEVLIVRADGQEMQGRVSELQAHENDSSLVNVEFKGLRYLMRVNNLGVEEDTGRYLNLDLLFAALNPHTEGIYIRGEITTSGGGGRKVKKATDEPYWDSKEKSEETAEKQE
ncbi:hypothetical protein FGO68_gene15497 [Halteria grandinella]|uniref:Uncharacterized protein n=1 Tax=Halteria grandinella TaxID=5974 RepID=A0A8J8P6Y7_HALGN|nr:hypothetical protein FGO68_gene15497 [Halteria grandinella]